MATQNQNKLVIAIVVSGLIVGMAVFLTRGNSSKQDNSESAVVTDVGIDAVRAVQDTDHVLGNPNAKIVFIVYSDFGCPYCKEFHSTMRNIIEYYGRDGSVAWVFRHIPVAQIHEESPMYALASECVANEGGNQAFWKFSDILFDTIDLEKKPDTNTLLTLAEQSGVSRQTFAACMRSNELMKNVTRDFDEAVAAGASASPFTIVLTSDGRVSFDGARDFMLVSMAIQSALDTPESGELALPSLENNATRFNVGEESLATSSVEDALLPSEEGF